MTLTILLAKVLGLYMLIVGAAVLLRHREYIAAFAALAEDRLTLVMILLVELLAGLFLVITHNRWTSLPEGIISAIGWLAVVEAVTYLLLPAPTFADLFRSINRPATYVIGGIASMIVGAYLTAFGFGWL